MARINIANTLTGCLLLLVVGVGIVLPGFPDDGFDVFWTLLAFVVGLVLVVRSAGPRTVRLRLLEWFTSRQGKTVEWAGGAIVTILFVWDFGVGFPLVLLVAFALGRVLGRKRYYEQLNDEKQRLQRDNNA